MTTTRRGLLGMFAAGAAAAILPSGVIMPVRKVWAPDNYKMIVADFDAGVSDKIAIMECWWQEKGGPVIRAIHTFEPGKVVIGDQIVLGTIPADAKVLGARTYPGEFPFWVKP